jgi:hypothetical protein
MTSGIIEILIENAGVQALVGRTVDNSKYKVFPVIAEPKDKAGNEIKAPYIVAWNYSSDPTPSLTKDISSMLDYPRIRISCWSKSFRLTELMAEAVRAALEPSGFQTDNGYLFSRIWLVDTVEVYNKESGLFGCYVDVAIEWKRADGAVFQQLIDNQFVHWGGLWVWADHDNALPTDDVLSGKVWITVGDRFAPGVDGYVPNDSFMTAKVDGASAFNQFTFNLA